MERNVRERSSIRRKQAFGSLLLALILGPSRVNQEALQASIGRLYDPAYAAPSAKAGVECEPILPSMLQPSIEKAAKREGLDADLLLMVILRESSFQPCAVSPVGARGLMQLMPETAEELGVRDPFDPEENLAAGAKFLGKLLRRYGGDLTLALGAYHMGPGAMDDRKQAPLGPATRQYVSGILRLLEPPEPGKPSS